MYVYISFLQVKNNNTGDSHDFRLRTRNYKVHSCSPDTSSFLCVHQRATLRPYPSPSASICDNAGSNNQGYPYRNEVLYNRRLVPVQCP